MVKSHLKRKNAPKTWPIARKERKWIVRPLSSQPLEMCMPVSVFLREILKIAKTVKEVKTILNQKIVMVNGKIIKDPKYGVGFMDVLDLTSLKEKYRVLLNKQGRMVIRKIDDKEGSLIPRKITGKKLIKGGKTQLSFSDGCSLLADAKNYKVGDTLVFENGKIKEHLKFEKGALVLIVHGKQTAMCGKMEEVRTFAGTQPDNIVYSVDGKSYETRKEYAMVIGKDKPVIALVE